MKKSLTASVAFAMLLTSCTSPTELGIIGGADGPTATVAESATDTTVADTAESTESDAETAPSMPDDSGFTALEGDLEFYRFDGGNASVVWSDKSVWVFDYVLDEVIPVFDHEKALADVDFRGEGAQYFADYTLTPDFRENSDYELCITFTVSSTTADASYEAYCFYTLNSPTGLPRGELRGYYRQSLSYPGSDDPITVTDVGEREKLYIDQDNYLFSIIAAVVTADTAAMDSAFRAQSGTFDAWQSVRISDYTVTRSDFSFVFPDELEAVFTVSESALDTLPVGKYKLTVADGPGLYSVQLSSLDRPTAQRELCDAEEWVKNWTQYFGGAYHDDMSITELDSLRFYLICFYQSCCLKNGDETSYEGFVAFCRDVFGIADIDSRIGRREYDEHGAHGGSYAYMDIVGCETTEKGEAVTVNFYADSMKTVLARTTVYTVRGTDGRYVFADVTTVNDSGLPVKHASN